MSVKVRFVKPHYLQVPGGVQAHVTAGEVRETPERIAAQLVAARVAVYEEMPIARQTPPRQNRPGRYGDLSSG